MIGLCSSLKSVPLQALVPAKAISPAKIEPVEPVEVRLGT